MMKNKIKLVEMQVNANQDNELIEDIDTSLQPDFEILDVTVIPNEEYMPTVQGILIDLEESNKLHESQSDKLSINILSETVNPKTNYSMSLFEFESSSSTITLSITLTESEKYKGVFNVSAYTTKGQKVFETNTQTPAKAIQGYLNSLSNEYLVEGHYFSDEAKERNEVIDDVVSRLTSSGFSIVKTYDRDGWGYVYYDLIHDESKAPICISVSGDHSDSFTIESGGMYLRSLLKDAPHVLDLSNVPCAGSDKNYAIFDIYKGAYSIADAFLSNMEIVDNPEGGNA